MANEELYGVEYCGTVVFGIGRPGQLAKNASGPLELKSAAVYGHPNNEGSLRHMLKEEQVRAYYHNFEPDMRCSIVIPRTAIRSSAKFTV